MQIIPCFTNKAMYSTASREKTVIGFIDLKFRLLKLISALGDWIMLAQHRVI